jgi:UDP-N-acetylmuramyl pentapeptide phosphotransferase/UDP-N-acetylglucosamine-1-phosphate transferase
LSVLFTAFAVAGVANSFNIIDGFNGLAGGVALISLAALGAIAWQAGDREIVQLCIVLGAATLGFLLVNFPLGKIFLGDGGAYLLGFLVSWIAVMLPMRNPSISAWACLLACGYPILETAFSIVRKLERRGSHPCQPDAVHLHMLFHKRLSRRLYRNTGKVLQNSLTSPFAWAFAMLPAGVAVLWPTDTAALALGFGVSALIYRALYLRLTQFRWYFLPAARRTARPVRTPATQRAPVTEDPESPLST